MSHSIAVARLSVILASASILSCRTHSSTATMPMAPDYEGQVIGPSFEAGSPGLGELTLIRVKGSSPAPAPGMGFARIDGSTKFIFSKTSRVDSTQVGLPGLQHSYVRVWYRGGSTSRTSSEIWGNAALVRVDSSGVTSANGRVH